MNRNPRWLREQRRINSVETSVEDLHAEVDRVWLDVYQLLRAHGLRSTVDPRRGPR